ncbi:MAG TPA: glycine dehydrogenase (aminomethyl-transferring), partial [Chthoniobacterales bacterium]|nr:glycine dehydrogenase (aminomethyl-transferring) [Chthoniobacterales bacterium]
AVAKQDDHQRFFVASNCHPQTIAVVRTRAEALGIEVVVGLPEAIDWAQHFCGALVQYPNTDGRVDDYRAFVEAAHAAGSLVAVAADLLSLTLLVPPGEFNADVCVGSSQRFGVPIGFGGPHAAFFATRDEFKRHMPGRLVGVSKDSAGRPAYRLALQTREQHIRRDKATSNICTAQVLLAVIAATYAVYHGPDGLRAIATEIRRKTELLAAWLSALNFQVLDGVRFDTIKVHLGAAAEKILGEAAKQKINFRLYPDGWTGIALDETVSAADLEALAKLFDTEQRLSWDKFRQTDVEPVPDVFQRQSAFLQQPVFNSFHTETELMRYLKRLENRDLSLTTSMIPLGSCTMKLNAAVEMLPVTWPGFGQIHPFTPREQTVGYRRLISGLEDWLARSPASLRSQSSPTPARKGNMPGC